MSQKHDYQIMSIPMGRPGTNVQMVPAVALFASVALAFQPPASTPSAPELVARVIDSSQNPVVRAAYFSEICRLAPDQRDGALRDIIRSGDKSFSASAASYSVVYRDEAAVPLIIEYIPRFSEAEKATILVAVDASHFSGRLRDIPREIVREVITGRSVNRDSPEIEVDSLNIAVAILSVAPEGADMDLIVQVAEKAPQAHAVWLALLAQNQMSDQLTVLARTVYRDQGTSILGRVAAAVALAPTDNDARQFADIEIRKYLMQFCARDMSDLLIERAQGRDFSGSREQHEYLRNMRLVGMLRFLDERTAESLVFEQFSSCMDGQIRQVLGIIAVVRWPARFLELDKSIVHRIDASALNGVLALLVHHHPDLKSATLARFPDAKVDKVLDQIRSVSVASVSVAAGMALQGW